MATSKIPTMLRLPETLHLKIKQLAELEHRSMNGDRICSIKVYL